MKESGCNKHPDSFYFYSHKVNDKLYIMIRTKDVRNPFITGRTKGFKKIIKNFIKSESRCGNVPSYY